MERQDRRDGLGASPHRGREADAGFPRLKVTLRQLFNLDSLGNVPKTWPGDNYDYFWIIDYDGGRITNFQMLKQTFAAPYQNVPSNDWDTSAALPKDCEGSKDAM